MLPHLSISDAFVVVLYLGMLLAVGSYALMKQKTATDAYFFAAGKTGWMVLGASLFSSQFLLAAFFPLNGSVLAVVLMVLTASAMMLIVLAGMRVFAARTAGASNDLRSSDESSALFRSASIYGASLLPVIVLGIVRVAAALLFCSLAMESFTGWNPGASTIVIILAVGLFTIIGGFRAVSILQAFLMTGTFTSIIVMSVTGSRITYEPGVLPVASLCGLVVLTAWSWKGDHYFVHHLARAHSGADITKGLLLTVVLNMICIAVMLFTPVEAAVPTDADLPSGVQGAIIIGILSLVVSALAGNFSSTAAFFTLRIIQPRLSNPSERKLVLIGRLVTTAFVIAAITAVMAVRALGAQGGGMLQTVIGVTAAPLAGMYCCNRFNRTRGLAEASWPAVPAFMAGAVRVLIEAASSQGVAMGEWAGWFLSVHFLALSFALFAATCAIFAVRMIPSVVGRYVTGTE